MTSDEKPESVFTPYIDPCDIYLPMEVTGELMRCAARNGRISYEYLLAIYRKGKADAVLQRAPAVTGEAAALAHQIANMTHTTAYCGGKDTHQCPLYRETLTLLRIYLPSAPPAAGAPRDVAAILADGDVTDAEAMARLQRMLTGVISEVSARREMSRVASGATDEEARAGATIATRMTGRRHKAGSAFERAGEAARHERIADSAEVDGLALAAAIVALQSHPPPAAGAPPALVALVQEMLVAPVPPTIATDDAFRDVYTQGYRHALGDVLKRLGSPAPAPVAEGHDTTCHPDDAEDLDYSGGGR